MDMGICARIGIGGVSITDSELQKKLMAKWNLAEFPSVVNENQNELLDKGLLKNLFVFGEDPIGCSYDKQRVLSWFDKASFVLVQDYFMTETAMQADLILPASLPAETGGSFTSTQKVIQKFEKSLESRVEQDNIQQLLLLLSRFDNEGLKDVADVIMEAISLLSVNTNKDLHGFTSTGKDNYNRMFDYGCDSVVKYFEEYFENVLKKMNYEKF
jgi:formate dehydrogenase major subunit